MEMCNIEFGLRFIPGWQSVSQNLAELQILNFKFIKAFSWHYVFFLMLNQM